MLGFERVHCLQKVCGASPRCGQWTLGAMQADHLYLKPASECPKIDYPKPDGKLTFDSSVPAKINLASRAGIALLPRRRLRVRQARRCRQTGDQRAELRPLQDLRHRGSNPE